MIRRLTAPLLALAFLLVAVSPTFAYQLEDVQWPDGTNHFDVCIKNNGTDGFTSSARRDQITGWVKSLEFTGDLHRPDISITVNSTQHCSGDQLEIVISQPASLDPPKAMRTGFDQGGIWPFTYRTHAFILVNGEFSDTWYWASSKQDCAGVLVGMGCRADAQTLIKHEMMHALGVWHTTDDTVQRCSGGYDVNADESACSSLGQKVMSWNAGIEFPNRDSGYRHQGYRHDYKYDDKQALLDLYGDCAEIAGCY